MIEINLLPQELRVSRKKEAFDLKILLLAIPALGALIIAIHVLLIILMFYKNLELGILESKWKDLAPQRKQLEELKKEITLLSQDAKVMQDMVAKRINWAEKLNKTSLSLPSGIWINEMAFNGKELAINCSVISLQKDEINLINKFVDKLENEAAISSNISNIELGTMQRRTVGSYDIVDFVLTGKLK